ncbi:MAG: hypothetical protein FJX76_14175 [Armatimonadetes bacterium]|nr:hypothetical protein [Armatimonadota bacterium]
MSDEQDRPSLHVDRPARPRPLPPETAASADAEERPRLGVMPPEVRVEATGQTASGSIVVINRGGGRLEGRVEVDQGWATPRPDAFQDNRQRIDIDIDLTALPLDEVSLATIRVTAGQDRQAIPLMVLRFGFSRVLDLFRKGNAAPAKEACRRLLQDDPADLSASLLMAAIYFDERNFPAALRMLCDLAEEPAPEQPPQVPDDVLDTIVSSLDAHPGALRNYEHGIPIFERMLDVASPQARPHIAAALRAAFVGYLQDHLQERRTSLRGEDDDAADYVILRDTPEQPEGMDGVRVDSSRTDNVPNEEIHRLSRYVSRAGAQFPDDPEWPALRTRLDQVLRERARAGQKRAVRAVVRTLMVVGIAYAAFVGLRAWRLSAARGAVQGASYAAAVQITSGVLQWSPGNHEARALRAEANAAWARSLFDGGAPGQASERMTAAITDFPDDPGLLEARRDLLQRWGDLLLQRGEVDAALVRFREVQALAPTDARVARRIQSLEGPGKLYRTLAGLERGSPIPQSGDAPSRPLERPPPAALRVLTAGGLPTFSERLQVLRADLDGDQRDEVSIAGTEGGRGGLRVLRPHVEEAGDGAVRLEFEEVLRHEAAADAWLDGMRLVRLEPGRPREAGVLVVGWRRPPGNGLLGHSVFVYQPREGKTLKAWLPPDTPGPVQILDSNHDGTLEIWLSKVFGEVAVPVPYRWRDGQVTDLTVDFSDYYLDELIPDLERRLLGTRDPRERASLEAAIAAARALARK